MKNKIIHNVGFIPGVVALMASVVFFISFIRDCFDYTLFDAVPSLAVSLAMFVTGLMLVNIDI